MSQAIEAEEAFLRAKKKIARKLNAAFVLKDFPDKTFLPFGKAKDIILETTLDDFTELCKSADDVDAERDKDPKPTIDIIRTEEENSNQPCLVLAVLLCIDKFSPKDWRRFRNYLKERSRSHRLPLDKDDACKAFGPALGQSFYENQFPFCPIVLQKGIANIYTGTRSKCRLPYLEQTEHGSGSFGKVFKVKMPQGHLQGDGEIMTAPLARKEFKIRGRESFQKEWNTMQQILQRSRSNDNIIKTYASLETDLELSIFYPLAKCNLQEYLDNKAGVSSSVCDRLRLKAVAYSTRRELFKQIKGLAKALESLHSFDNNHGIATSCFHMDLKPENILIFPPKDGVELWKLTDFGISHVEQIGKKEHKMRSLDDLFVRRPGTPHQVSGPGGNGTFLAPEAMRPKAQVTNVYDVWSFACVVLLVMSFAHGGSSEARSFRDGLCKNDDGSEGSDWFFVTRDPKKFHSLLFRSKKTYKDQNEHGRPIVYMQNPRVAEQLARLSSSVQNACKDFYRALSSFLLKEALVPDPTERINASVFSKEFAKYFEKYLPASEERPSNFDGDQDYCEPRDLLHVSITYTMSSSEYVAFIAPSEIYIYETLNSRGSLAIELRPPSGKFWSCCALSDDLMCAAIDSSSSGSFECKVVSLKASQTPILLKLACGPIKMCAISPDSMYLAFVTKESRQHLGEFRVHLFARNDLRRIGVSAEDSKLNQDSMVVECAKVVRLQFSPDGRFLHAVFTLNPGRRSGAKSLMWEVCTGRRVGIREDILDPIGNDNAYEFVTTSRLICSESSSKPTIMLLTQGCYLHVIDTSSYRIESPQDLGRSRRVIDFVIDESTDKIFCLAKAAGSNTTRLFCSPYPIPRPEKWKDVTPPGARIPSDYDSSMDSFCFRPGFWTADDKWVAPNIIIATVRGSILTFKVR